jgi:hypothetical protein
LVVAVALAAVSGCASSYMRTSAGHLAPAVDYAIVSFVRPQAFAFGQSLSLWDRERFIGMLDAKKLVQYRATPGEHLFMGMAGNFAYVRANLEGGKHYVVVARLFPADDTVTMSNIGVALNPASKAREYSDEDLAGWVNGATPTEPVPEKVAEYEAKFKPQVTQALADHDAGQVQFREIAPDDNRL